MDESGSGLLIIGLMAALWFGWHEHSRAEDLQTKLDAAHSQIDDLKTKSAALEEASNNLKQQMDRFETENWRDVLPDAKAAADDVDSAQSDLKTSADDADGSE